MSADSEFPNLPVEDQLRHLDISLEDRVDYLVVYRSQEGSWGAKSTSRELPSFSNETYEQILEVTAANDWEPLDRDFGPECHVFRRPRS